MLPMKSGLLGVGTLEVALYSHRTDEAKPLLRELMSRSHGA